MVPCSKLVIDSQHGFDMKLFATHLCLLSILTHKHKYGEQQYSAGFPSAMLVLQSWTSGNNSYDY